MANGGVTRIGRVTALQGALAGEGGLRRVLGPGCCFTERLQGVAAPGLRAGTHDGDESVGPPSLVVIVERVKARRAK